MGMMEVAPQSSCNGKIYNRSKIVTAQPQPQPNSTSTRVGVDKVISWTTTPTPLQLLRHFQTTYETDFRYETLF